MKKSTKIIVLILIIVLLGVCLIFKVKNKSNNSNNLVNEGKVKFSKLYDVDKNNVFEEISAKSAVNLLENRTGILYLGYPDCPWCQDLVPLLNESAKENNINSIYYIEDFFDMRPDKVENPVHQDEYNNIVKFIDEYEKNKNEVIKDGNIIKVPLVLFVKNGEIVGFQKGTVEEHYIEKNENDEYYLRDLTEDEKSIIRKKLNDLIDKTYSNMCSGSC